MTQFNYFDNVPAGNPIQVGEFAVTQSNTADASEGVDWSLPQK